MRRNRRGYGGRKRAGNGRLPLLAIVFWAVSGFAMIAFLNGGPDIKIEAEKQDMGKMYIDSIFPTVSRGSEYESREAMGTSLEPAPEGDGLLNEEQSESIFKSLMGSMFPGAQVLDDDLAEEDPGYYFDPASPEYDSAVTDNGQSVIDTEDSAGISPDEADYSKPLVIIYHTHATESYQPVTEGNFHALDAYGTVREVGVELAKSLEENGIQVIHDTTIHDSPSYNQSYTRSLETIKNLLGENGSNVYVIDLHRDAAAYVGNTAITTSINNQTIAKFSLVVGNGNDNAAALREYADDIIRTAKDLYPGFEGKVIEKQYKFNQYVSDHHLLLEVGNNENTIEQAKLTGKYFGNVMAAYIKDNQ